MKIIFLCLSILCTNTMFSQAQKWDGSQEFIFAVIEFSQDNDGELGAEILAHRVVNENLKSPTPVQEKHAHHEGHDHSEEVQAVIQMLNESGEVLDEVTFINPLEVELGSADENNKPAKFIVQEKSFPRVFRRWLSEGASTLRVAKVENENFTILNSITIR